MISDLIPQQEATLSVGKAANKKAAARVFVDFRSRLAANTLRRYDADLALFAQFLAGGDRGITCAHLEFSAKDWHKVTWGLVSEFCNWMLAEGYAIRTVNLRLSTIKQFAALALAAGALEQSEYAMICTLKSYRDRAGRNLDEKRRMAGAATRKGAKKREPNFLTEQQVKALLDQPDTPQGRRDRFMVALGVFHGLRVSELAGLQRGDFDLNAGTIHYYSRKVDKWFTKKLEPEALAAARAYLSQDAPSDGVILIKFRPGRKDAPSQSLSERGINKHFRALGETVGIDNLSPHDMRHTGATRIAQLVRDGKKSLEYLRDWGGWTTFNMAERYVKAVDVLPAASD